MTRGIRVQSVQQYQLAQCLFSFAQPSVCQPVSAITSSITNTLARQLLGSDSISTDMAATGVLSSPTKQSLQALLSPSKQVVCSPTRHSISTCTVNLCQQPLSPLAKRSGSALRALSSAAYTAANTSNAAAHECQEEAAVCGATASLAAVKIAGVTHGPATTPGAYQDSLALGAFSSRSTGHQQYLQANSTSGTAAQHRPASSSFPAVPCTTSISHSTRLNMATMAPEAEVVPSPRDILDVPPELEQVDAGSGLPSSHHHHSHRSGQQQHHRPVMSGRRVTSRFDVPLGWDWLANAPNHEADLGAGRLELIMGPMFAGKTTELLQRVQEVSSGGQIAVAVKSSKDERYGCHWVITHDGRCMRCYTADSLQQFKQFMGPHYQKLQVLAIDEAQFFPDLLDFCRTAVDLDGKHVIVAGLSGDFKRQRFGQLLELMPLADNITQLRSKCAFCDQDALFSLRIIENGPQALVGETTSTRQHAEGVISLTHTHARQ